MFHRLFTTSSAAVLGVALAAGAWAQQQQQPGFQQDRQYQQQQWEQPGQQQRIDQPRVQLQPGDPDLQRHPAEVRDRTAPHVVSGTITGISEVPYMNDRHLRVNVETFDGQFLAIDLGSARQIQHIRNLLETGERITVTGEPLILDGRQVFAADNVRVAGERFDLDEQARLTGFRQDTQQEYRVREDRWTTDRQQDRWATDRQQDRWATDRQQDRWATDRQQPLGQQQQFDRQQARTISGTISNVRETRHLNERHIHVDLRTQDDRQLTVDLGPVEDVRQIRNQLQRGQRINVTGQQQMLDGRQYFVAQQLQVGQQQFNLDQWAQQARQQYDRQQQQFDRQQQQMTQRDGQYDRQQQQFDRQQQQMTQRDRQQYDRQQQQFDRQQQARDQRGTQQRMQQRLHQPPEGYVLVSERVVLLMTDQLNRHFVNARTQLQQQNQERAAAEIRLASEYLEMYAGIAEGEIQQDLDSTQDQLRQLADRIEQGDVTQRQQLDRTFAQAHRALAKYNFEQARQFRDEDRSVAAGYRLRAAAQHLQQATTWADTQIDPDTARIFQEAQTAGARMIRGQEVRDEDDLVNRLEEQLERLDQQFN
jgi:hypothetical protein